MGLSNKHLPEMWEHLPGTLTEDIQYTGRMLLYRAGEVVADEYLATDINSSTAAWATIVTGTALTGGLEIATLAGDIKLNPDGNVLISDDVYMAEDAYFGDGDYIYQGTGNDTYYGFDGTDFTHYYASMAVDVAGAGYRLTLPVGGTVSAGTTGKAGGFGIFTAGAGSAAKAASAAAGGAGGYWNFVCGNGAAGDGVGADGKTGYFLLTGGTWIEGGTDDYTFGITATLNAAEAAGGTDVYRMIKGAMTSTTVTGWDTVYLLDLLDDNTTKFNVTQSGLCTPADGVYYADNIYARFGNSTTAPDARFYSDGTCLALDLDAIPGLKIDRLAIADYKSLTGVNALDVYFRMQSALDSNCTGGSFVLTCGAKHGSGTDGVVVTRSGKVYIEPQASAGNTYLTIDPATTLGTEIRLDFGSSITTGLALSWGGIKTLILDDAAPAAFLAANDTDAKAAYWRAQSGGTATSGNGRAGAAMAWTAGSGSAAWATGGGTGGAAGGFSFQIGDPAAGDGAGAGGAGGSFSIGGGTHIEGGADDKVLNLTVTLNATEAASGTDNFSLIKGVVTTTDTTGWDNEYFLNFYDDSTQKYYLDLTGLAMFGGGIYLPDNVEIKFGNSAAIPDAAWYSDGAALALNLVNVPALKIDSAAITNFQSLTGVPGADVYFRLQSALDGALAGGSWRLTTGAKSGAGADGTATIDAGALWLYNQGHTADYGISLDSALTTALTATLATGTALTSGFELATGAGPIVLDSAAAVTVEATTTYRQDATHHYFYPAAGTANQYLDVDVDTTDTAVRFDLGSGITAGYEFAWSAVLGLKLDDAAVSEFIIGTAANGTSVYFRGQSGADNAAGNGYVGGSILWQAGNGGDATGGNGGAGGSIIFEPGADGSGGTPAGDGVVQILAPGGTAGTHCIKAFHDSSNGYIDNVTGELRLRTAGTTRFMVASTAFYANGANTYNIGLGTGEIYGGYFGEDTSTGPKSASGLYLGLTQEARLRWNKDATGYPAASLILGLNAVGSAASDRLALSAAAISGFLAANDADGGALYSALQAGGTVSSGTTGRAGASGYWTAGAGSAAKAASAANGGAGGGWTWTAGAGGAADGAGTGGAGGSIRFVPGLAGSGTTPGANGYLIFGAGTVNNSVDCIALISRDVDDTVTTNGHGFSDSSQVSRSGGIGYNSYDAYPNFTGASAFDHYAAFQARPDYGSAGTMTYSYGFASSLVVSAGTVTNHYGFHAANPTGAGAVTNAYGVYIATINKGATLNYSIYTGTAPSYFGGIVTCNNSGIAATSTDGIVIENNTAATSGVPIQYGPRVKIRGAAWNGSDSDTFDWIIENQPANATPITSTLYFKSSIEGVAGTNRLWLASNGILTAGSSIYAGGTAGTGTFAGGTVTPGTAATSLVLNANNYSAADSAIEAATGTWTHSSLEGVALEIKPTWNASGTASETCLKINSTSTAIGSGAYLLINALDDTASRWSLGGDGKITGTVTQSIAAAGSEWNLAAGTTTITAGVTAIHGFQIDQMTVSAGSALTADAAASLYIANAPVAGGSAVVTAAWAIWVDAGNVKFDGDLTVDGAISGASLSLTAPLTMAEGGTGADLGTGGVIGDLLYADAAATMTRLPAVAVGQVLVSAGTGTAPAYSASPSVTDLTTTRAGIATTPTDGVLITNTTAATNPAQVQMTPRLRFHGAAWNGSDTDSTDWAIDALPAAATPITSTLRFGHSLESAAYTYPMTLTNAGAATFLSSVTATSFLVGAAACYYAGGTDVAVADGGTGLSSYAVGDILHATGTGTIAGLADVAVGSVLVSGGVGVVSSWSVSPSVTSLTLTPTAALVGLTMTAALQTNTAGVIDLNCTTAGTGVVGIDVSMTTPAAGLADGQSMYALSLQLIGDAQDVATAIIYGVNLGFTANGGAAKAYGIYSPSTLTYSLYSLADIYMGASDIVTDTTTGMMIGTGSTQKIGFYGTTPAVQPAHVADPAGCAALTATQPGTGADATTWSGAQCTAAYNDLVALKAAADANNAAIDSILAQLATLGLQASA